MVRGFKETDLDKVMQIWLESNIKEHSFVSKDYWEIVSGFVRRAIGASEVYVCEKDGVVCGFIGLQDSYIVGLFVEETARSNGIGKKLLDYVKGIKKELTLNVYQKNERAVAFYKREQFVVEAESVDGNTNEMEFVMSWRNAGTV